MFGGRSIIVNGFLFGFGLDLNNPITSDKWNKEYHTKFYGSIIAVKLALKLNVDEFVVILILTGIISALTIGGKAMGKTIAINRSNYILYDFFSCFYGILRCALHFYVAYQLRYFNDLRYAGTCYVGIYRKLFRTYCYGSILVHDYE